MQTDVAETIFDIVKILPEKKQRKVLDIVRDLQAEEESGLLRMLNEIEATGRDLPDDAFEGVPTDGSANHDHYLYGAKKRY
ncbi:MAG TPA: hypothetical protein PLK77_05835 [Pyrinomonadaceae bacterium]|nr:hypothetical protein [Pyrinomonadaceae bacterium]